MSEEAKNLGAKKRSLIWASLIGSTTAASLGSGALTTGVIHDSATITASLAVGATLVLLLSLAAAWTAQQIEVPKEMTPPAASDDAAPATPKEREEDLSRNSHLLALLAYFALGIMVGFIGALFSGVIHAPAHAHGGGGGL